MKYLIILVLLLLLYLSCACVNQQLQKSQNETTNIYITPTQSPEPTFVAVKYSGTKTYSTVVPKTGGTTIQKDPVVGSWQMVNGPYDCMAYFLVGNTGVIRCNALVASGTKSFAWALNETNSYRIGLSDGTGIMSDAFINADGHMTSNILPEGAYLVKV